MAGSLVVSPPSTIVTFRVFRPPARTQQTPKTLRPCRASAFSPSPRITNKEGARTSTLRENPARRKGAAGASKPAQGCSSGAFYAPQHRRGLACLLGVWEPPHHSHPRAAKTQNSSCGGRGAWKSHGRLRTAPPPPRAKDALELETSDHRLIADRLIRFQGCGLALDWHSLLAESSGQIQERA